MILRVFESWGMNFDYKGMGVPKSSGPPDPVAGQFEKKRTSAAEAAVQRRDLRHG
jgi:hypothetical protein